MSNLELLLLSVSLGVDSFSLSLAVGAFFPNSTSSQKFRLIFSFCFCHFVMLLLGWFLGASVVEYISSFDHWLIFGFLAFIGGKMLYEAISGDNDEDVLRKDFFTFRNTIMLGVFTGMDALAVGFSFALMSVNVWIPNIVITLVVGIMAFTGLLLGDKLGCKFPNVMKFVAGIVLIAIGVLTVLEHYGISIL